MIETIKFHINELDLMKQYPKELFFIGNTSLLKQRKISIVGSRKANQYAKHFTQIIASKLSSTGICIVSGGAIGIDTIAHQAAGVSNTIMVAGTGLDKRYPAINKKLIQQIEQNGLVISQFKEGTPSQRYTFPLRNELIVALGEILLVMHADIDSGTMHSIKYAKKMGKNIYVLPHHIGQSSGTNQLLLKNEATAIYDIDDFISQFKTNNNTTNTSDEFLIYCQSSPSYDEAVAKYATKVFEYELRGLIEIKYGKITLLSKDNIG